ncbi:CPBP family intramembrane glutamic endopeptidase [Moheibacter lacus]|uniref:CPBP family intramembrane metalloprotease n=1 Tax=Moheibacter lacus TaxID=2745851 RepID=A0A838ZFX5_9FLAO|nr:type II CAAX endopeptidase family protein [Moheibacter lacus]MBA5628621.1 CPBP family intramembrane metalloprotease [Moheibacter lacus]
MNEESEALKPEIQDKSRFKISIGKSFAVAFIIVVCLQLIGSVVNIPSFKWEYLYHITLPLSFLFGGIVAIFILLPFVKTNWKSIVDHIWKPASIGVFLLSILFYIFTLPFAEFLASMVPTSGIDFLEEFYNEVVKAFEMMLDYKIAGFITVCILAPIIEEILFRGILLRGLLQKGISPILAIILSSFLFGLAHLNPWQFMGAGLLGAVFGFVYYRTKALWICIFLHALNNSISFIMMLKFETMDENVTNPNDMISVVVCFIMAVLIGFGIYKLTKNKLTWN